jgi:Bacterial regulatory proteins, luxR family
VGDGWATGPLINRAAVAGDSRVAALLRELTPSRDAKMPKSTQTLGGDSSGREFNLTNREIQVLRPLWKGGSNKAIARDLFLTEEHHRDASTANLRKARHPQSHPSRCACPRSGRHLTLDEQSSHSFADLMDITRCNPPALFKWQDLQASALLAGVQIGGPLARASKTRRAYQATCDFVVMTFAKRCCRVWKPSDVFVLTNSAALLTRATLTSRCSRR